MKSKLNREKLSYVGRNGHYSFRSLNEYLKLQQNVVISLYKSL